MQKLLWLGLAGAAGTLARYSITRVIPPAQAGSFPWATLLVNITGCFIAGLVISVSENRFNLGLENKAILLIGFLGAFTTFSALVRESGELLGGAQWAAAVGNLFMHNIFGVLLFLLGLFLGRFV